MLYMVPDTFPIVRLDRDTHVSYASRCWDTRVLDSCWCDSLLSLLVIKRNTIPGSSQLMWLWIAFQPIAPQCLLQKIIMLVYGTLVDVPCTRQSFGISQNYLWMPVLKALTPATRHLYSIMPLTVQWKWNLLDFMSCNAQTVHIPPSCTLPVFLLCRELFETPNSSWTLRTYVLPSHLISLLQQYDSSALQATTSSS